MRSWRGWFFAGLLLTLGISGIVATVLNTAGVFYKPPKPREVHIHVVSVASNATPGGGHSNLTTLPYLVFRSSQQISYAASSQTAATIRHGGEFMCTITKPVTDQIARAAKCSPRLTHR